MYQPPQFRSADPDHARALMQAHPLASLVSTDDTGFPVVTHLPLQLQEQGGERVLLGHCARANPHWRYLAERPEALVTFMGPSAYLSPSVYPDLARVPSWNYLAVHCRVEARIIDEADGKDALLKALIAQHEPAYAAQWRALDEDYTSKMLRAIVAFELRVLDLQCTLKLNQHRPESHAALHAAYRAGSADAQALAQWMETLGMVKNASFP
ncbi:MAG: FMN-binding negative transcriptional regulator [Giesbergeria sp.]|jgi:transcriptional regulator